MANTLSLLFWCISAAVTGLASADLLLLDRQKKWINDRAIDFWDWLDDQRELKYLAYLRKFRWQRFVVIMFATIALIATVFVGLGIYTGGFQNAGEADVWPYLEHYLLGGYLGSFVTALFMARTGLPQLLNWVTKTEGSWAYLWRSTLVLVATVAATFASQFLIELINRRSPEVLSAEGVALASYLRFSSPITAFLYGLSGSLNVTLLFVILISWVLLVLPVIFVLLLTILFRVAQFVVVRVAENPKGPQYALSALLAAVGAAVRYMAV